MRFLLTLFAFFAFAVPAQADITSSVITTPESPHYVLSHGVDAKVAVAGTAKGVGNVDIVCADGSSTTILASDVPVAGDGAFSDAAVALDAVVGPYGWGLTCRLHAIPAGTIPDELVRFRGPVLAISLLTLDDPNGLAADGIDNYDLWLAGADRATELGAFGRCTLWSVVLDRTTLAEEDEGHVCAGGTVDAPQIPLTGVTVDGQGAYPPALGSVGGYGTGGLPGAPTMYVLSVDFDADTGAVVITEEDRFAKCGPDAVYPPTQFTCTQFDAVPVRLRRTTSVTGGDHVVRVVDHWSSTDGQAHRLDLAITGGQCCTARHEFRFPGESGFAQHGPNSTVAGPFAARAPIFARDAAGGGAGSLTVPLQAADGARFVAPDQFGLEYRNRKIPATGELTFTHYYVTTRSAGELDAAAAKLTGSHPAPAPHGGSGPVITPPAPQFSRHGRLRLRRVGRTFRVTTRDRVVCACTVHVSGRWVVPTALKASFGRTNAVRFRLTRSGARKLRRAGHLRMAYVLAAPAVTKQRTVRLRIGRS
jgi:hypothetical protein